MSPKFLAALEKFHNLTQSLNGQNLVLRRLLERGFSDDLERAADAIRRIEREFDPALAALLWGFFWIRQGDLSLAKRELESIEQSGRTQTLWGGIGLMMSGEICIELGETRSGAKFIRRARKILDAPP
jgi:hypothetical protein